MNELILNTPQTVLHYLFKFRGKNLENVTFFRTLVSVTYLLLIAFLIQILHLVNFGFPSELQNQAK